MPGTMSGCFTTPYATRRKTSSVTSRAIAIVHGRRSTVPRSPIGSHKKESGAPDEAIHHFFAEGMLLNVAASLELGGKPDTWSLSGLLGQADSSADAGGAS